MAEVQTQTGAPNVLESGSLAKDDLVTRLDELLERYLNTLDEYQKAQEQLTNYLSSGYLSLAQANFNNRTATRYGQDYYDERMQASRKIAWKELDSKITFSVPIATSQDPKASQDQEEETHSTPKEQPTSNESSPKSKSTNEKPKESTPSTTKNSTDPLKWFGILVPPALRSAQGSFVSAVEGPIPQLATLALDLKNQEIEIGRMRKQIKKGSGN